MDASCGNGHRFVYGYRFLEWVQVLEMAISCLKGYRLWERVWDVVIGIGFSMGIGF